MYRFKDIVVGVALDAYDDALIDYASLVAFMGHADRVRFVHVQPSPLALGGLYQDYISSLDEVSAQARQRLEAVVDEHFHGPSGTEVRCELRDGNPLAELLRTARDEGADLVMVGKDHDGGTLAEKLARKAPCSVLIVPEAVPERIQRVLVPVDFSSHAADAVDVAAAFADAAELTEVHLLHVYTVPTTYLKLGKTYEEAHDDIEARARKHLDAFVAELDLHGLKAVGHIADGDDVHRVIDDQIKAIDADMVVIGTRGRTATAAVLLGSVAEQTVRTAPVPVVAVKRKGATLSLLDALFEL